MSVWLLSLLNKFRRSRAGNVALMTALIMPVAVLAVGVALDVMELTKVRQQLDDAADAAALAAVSQSTLLNTSGGATNTQALINVATATFNNNVSHIGGATVTALNVSITPLVNGVQSRVTYTVSVPPGLSQMILPTVNISGTATAEDSLPKYVSFYMALDISQSMGIGATQADMNNLMSKTPDSCAFGCHLAINSGYPSYWQIARNNNILMRIDSLRDATQQLVDTAVAKTVVANEFKIGLYSMHKQLATIMAPSTNLSSVRTAAGSIDLGSVTSGGDAQTNFDVALPQLNSTIPTPGNGLTASTPLAFAFIITDGVQDEIYANNPSIVHHPYETTSGSRRYYAPLDPALCTTMKNRGVTVAVLYTTYLPITNNSWYNSYVSPFNSQIANSLKACASGGFFFTATTDAEIHSQLQSMFLTALQSVRLSS